MDWQEQIVRDLFGIVKPNGYRQFNTAYIEIPKKNGKSELAAAVALLLCCGDGSRPVRNADGSMPDVAPAEDYVVLFSDWMLREMKLDPTLIAVTRRQA